MGLELLEKLTDAYERKARLYPALLALIPPLGIFVGLHGITLQLESGLLGLLTTFGIFYLLASIVRELGKRLEVSLFAAWGGKPTTQLLRHCNHTIDPVTKARYHAFLSQRIGIKFPSETDEVRDPKSADYIYESGVKWLLDHTRDRRMFNLLFQENIAYGFRRNSLGLKPLAMAIVCGSILWVLIAQAFVTGQGFHREAFIALSSGAWASLATSSVMLAFWLFFLTKLTVRTAAFTYADMLLRACDVLK